MERARAINLPPAVIWLAAALVGVHLLRQLLDQDRDEWVLLAFSFIPQRYGELGDALPGGAAARLWSPVTYSFLHADIVHLLVNLVWMASFGGALARRFGTTRFLLLALISAVAGAGAHYVMHAADPGIVIGASGAVSGMMAATARFAFSPGGPLGGGAAADAYRTPAEPILVALRNRRALAFILIWFGVNLIFGLTGGLGTNLSGAIAWEAHIGGFLAGLLCFPLLDPVRVDGATG
jgi:membrane associated rhomboid family serine protease